MDKFRAVFHLDESIPTQVNLVLGNIANLLADLAGEGVEVELVANADGITAFLKTETTYIGQIQPLAAREVRFCLCANSMRQRGLNPEVFVEAAEIVPSGVSELVKKQALGWAYIRP